MNFTPCRLPGLVLIEPPLFADERGFFSPFWNRQTFLEAGITAEFVQDNHSLSKANILRGLHYQLGTPQGKLVRVLNGEVFDVAVDLRRSSPTFGQWQGMILSSANRHMLWLPPGFGHGFLTLSPEAEFFYKCTEYYAPQEERCIAWDDPDLGIQWPVPAGVRPIISAKDALGTSFRHAEVYP